jgi:hypothetical protein
MIDAAATVDVVKLRFYVDWLYQNHMCMMKAIAAFIKT